jgi:uncharacterized protein YlaI
MKELNVAVKNFQIAMKKSEIPSCFDSKEEYDFWLEGEKELPTQPIRHFICRDCTLSYQKTMITKGRCFNAEVDIQKIARI